MGDVIFGDRRGLAISLGALLSYANYWRVGVVIVDTPGLANAFVNLADGHLHLDHAVYGNSIEARGVMEVDGVPYGRNYGQLFATLPVYWILQGVSAVADPRIAIAAAWSLGIVAIGWDVAIGATVVYVLLTGLVHFHTAPHALGFVNEAMEVVRLALVRATIGWQSGVAALIRGGRRSSA